MNTFDISRSWTFLRGNPDYKKAIFMRGSKVTLPHSFNLGTRTKVLGGCWYFNRFSSPTLSEEQKAILVVGGANQRADVYIYGQCVCSHDGGFSSFAVDVTKYVKTTGEKNLLAINVFSGVAAESLPFEDEISFWGGILRFVRLEIVGKTYFDRCAPAVFSTRNKHGEKTVDGVFNVVNAEKGQQVKIEICDGNRVLQQKTQDVAETAFSLPFADAELWTTDNPKLYQLKFTVLSNGVSIDSKTLPLGFRWLTFAKRITLNGQEFPLKCVTLLPDLMRFGGIEHNLPLLLQTAKDCGANTVMCACYQQSDEFFALCDKLGLLVFDGAFVDGKCIAYGDGSTAARFAELNAQCASHPSFGAFCVDFSDLHGLNAENVAAATSGFEEIKNVNHKDLPFVSVSDGDALMPNALAVKQCVDGFVSAESQAENCSSALICGDKFVSPLLFDCRWTERNFSNGLVSLKGDKRDVWFLFCAYRAKKPFIYVVDYPKKTAKKTAEITVYTNAEQLFLSQNGGKPKKIKDDKIYKISVDLSKGKNVFYLSDGSNTETFAIICKAKFPKPAAKNTISEDVDAKKGKVAADVEKLPENVLTETADGKAVAESQPDVKAAEDCVVETAEQPAVESEAVLTCETSIETASADDNRAENVATEKTEQPTVEAKADVEDFADVVDETVETDTSNAVSEKTDEIPSTEPEIPAVETSDTSGEQPSPSVDERANAKAVQQSLFDDDKQ